MPVLAAIVFALLAVFLAPGGAQMRRATEYQVKAAFLYNFARFVKWPSEAFQGEDSFRLCVLGPDPFGPILDETVEGETSHGRRVEVERIPHAGKAGECQILFISRPEHPNRRLFDSLRAEPVLTVAEEAGLAREGAMINFEMEGSKVRFEVNVDAAEDAGLQVSSKLLKVARAVIREQER